MKETLYSKQINQNNKKKQSFILNALTLYEAEPVVVYQMMCRIFPMSYRQKFKVYNTFIRKCNVISKTKTIILAMLLFP